MATETKVEAMKLLVCAVLLFLPASGTKTSSPRVQIYSRLPGDVVKDNFLICHVTSFYPPEIRVELTQNELEMPGALQTDLAFEEDWHYHITKRAPFIPHKDHAYACTVTHMGRSTSYTWDPDM